MFIKTTTTTFTLTQAGAGTLLRLKVIVLAHCWWDVNNQNKEKQLETIRRIDKKGCCSFFSLQSLITPINWNTPNQEREKKPVRFAKFANFSRFPIEIGTEKTAFFCIVKFFLDSIFSYRCRQYTKWLQFHSGAKQVWTC